MANSKQIVYLSQTQYAELIANGTITVNGVTVTYDENDIYVTPQAEPVTDVRVAGTSIVANGAANIPYAKINTAGVVRNLGYGIKVVDSGVEEGALQIDRPKSAEIKNGAAPWKVNNPATQHESTFYGLAKAAGHDEKDSTEPLGTYTPEAKGAIQKMLGVSDLIATEENNLVASKAYKVGDVFTANGKLYKATAAIAADAAIITDGASANCEETSVGEGFVKKTDIASVNSLGIIKTLNGDYGLTIRPDGELRLYGAFGSDMKSGIIDRRALTPAVQHEAAFYGLAKAAGDTTQRVSDNAVGQYTDEAKSAIRTMLGAVGTEDYATSGTAGLVAISSDTGIMINKTTHRLSINQATAAQIKAGTALYFPIVPQTQHESTFYGLAKASGDTTQSASSNVVGVYTDNAKASIKAMLGIQDGSTGTVDITGTTPTITAVENTRYVCGEVTSLSFTPPASGISIVRFTSGSTVTVLTIPSTVKFPEWFDPTSLETNTIYEICVTDGEFGAVMSWAL